MSLVKQLDSIFLVHQCYSFYFDNCFTSLSSRPLRRTHVIPDSAKGRSDLHLSEIQRVVFTSPCVPFNARVREREMGFEQRNEPLSVVESVQVGLGTPVKPPTRLVNLCTTSVPVVVVVVRRTELLWYMWCKWITCRHSVSNGYFSHDYW